MDLSATLTIVFYFLIEIGIVVGVAAALSYFLHEHNNRTIALALTFLTVVAFALRYCAASTTDRLLGDAPQFVGDEARFQSIADAFLRGDVSFGIFGFPLYPAFMALCYVVFGHLYAVILNAQAVIGALTIPLVYFLARRFTGTRGSLFAAAITAILPALIQHVTYLYTEVLFTFLFILTLLSMLWALDKPSWSRFVLTGVLLALTAFCRPGSALMIVILPFFMPRTWSLKTRAALFSACLATLVGLIAPYVYYQSRTHNSFIFISLPLGVLWHGSPEYYHIMQSKPNAYAEVWKEELNPKVNGGHDPMTVEGDRYFTERAIASIKNEPGLYVWYSLQKLAYFWIGHPSAGWEWPTSYMLLSYFPIIGTRLLLLTLSVAAFIVLRHRLMDFGFLLAVFLYNMAVHAVLVPLARHSEPLYPLLAIFIAAAGAEVWRRLFERTRS